ncbi:MAG: hypothetical protein LAT61_12790 [Alcanivorax sp.]|nr:hypothetical protein [Alcanivorax sp.]
MNKTTLTGNGLPNAGLLRANLVGTKWLFGALLMLTLSAAALAAPPDLMGFCPDGTLVVNDTRVSGVDEAALRRDEQLLLDAFAAAGIRLPAGRISDATLQEAVTGIYISAEGVETMQGREGAGGTFILSTRWRHDALASGTADNLLLSAFSASFQSPDVSDAATLSLGDMPLAPVRQRLIGGPPVWGYTDCYLEGQCSEHTKPVDRDRDALDQVMEQLHYDRGLMLSDPHTGQFAVMHTRRLGERIERMMETCELIVPERE